MSWLEHHAASEQHAAAAEAEARSGNRVLAQQLYGKAAAAEAQALEALDPAKTRTYGITAVSAVALYHKAARSEPAVAVARRCLASDELPGFARHQLADLLDTIANAAAPEMSPMSELNVPDRTFFEGDNLPILAGINSESIDLNPDNAEYWHDRGAAHFRMGDYEQAIADFSRAIDLNPVNVQYRDNLRKAERRKGRLS